MKATVFMTTFTGVAALAIAPSLNSKKLEVEARKLASPAPPPTVDDTATRSAWVSSYKYSGKKFEWEHPEHWLPTGPGYLDLDTLDKGYHAHLMVMHDSNSWLHAAVIAVKRFFGVST